MKIWPSAFFPKSRKARFVLAVLLLLIVLLITLILFSKRSEPPFENTVNNSRPTRTTELARLNQDSDGDGLKDWEEQIYGTDPNKADTDGDKTPDGEEIKLDRDPLKPGPKDQLPKPLAEKTETSTAQENNLTKKFIDKFGERFILPRLNDPSVSLDNEKLSRGVLKDLPANISYANYFSSKDILVVNDNDPEAFKKYGEGFNSIISGSFKNLEKSELMIFSEALQVEDLSQLSILDVYLSAYQMALTKLKNLPVPAGLADLHLAYLNATKRQQIAVEKMRQAEKDIIKSAYGAQEYIAAGNEIANIEQKLQKISNEKIF